MFYHRFLAVALFVPLTFSACRDFNEDLFVEPDASFELSETEIVINEPVTITHTGKAQRLTLYTGTGSKRGIVLEPGVPFTTAAWSVPGTYDLTLIATGFKYQDAVVLADTVVRQLAVIDTLGTQLRKLSYRNVANYRLRADTLYNIPQALTLEYYVESFPDEQNRIIIPVYDFSRLQTTMGPVQKASDLKFQPGLVFSNVGATINFNGVTGTFTRTFGTVSAPVNHVDPNDNQGFVPVDYVVSSVYSDESVVYSACVIRIPEFKTFTIPGQTEMKILLDPSNYQIFDIHIWVNNINDAVNVVPSFTCMDDAQTDVYLLTEDEDMVLQTGGTSQVAELNGANYILVYKQPGYEGSFQLSSTIRVHVHVN